MVSKRAKRRRRRRSISRNIDRRRAASGQQPGGRIVASAIARRSRLRFETRKTLRGVGPGAGIKNVGRAAASSRIGRQALTVLRQKLSRIPVIARLQRRTRRAAQVPLVFGTRSPAVTTRSIAVRAAAPIAIGAGAGGVAFEAGRRIFDAIPGGIDVARRIRRDRSPSRRRSPTQQIPFTPGGIVPTDSITHTWVANGVPFAQLADGRVMVRRKNGTIKTFRRPRPIVLGRNPGVRDLVRADKKIEALLKMVKKRMPARRTAAPPRHSQQHN